MGILQQYIDDYVTKQNRSYGEYGGAADAYNAAVKSFNNTLVLGPDGKPVVLRRHEIGQAQLATPLEGYEDQGFYRSRQNPTSVNWMDGEYIKTGNTDNGFQYVARDPKTGEPTGVAADVSGYDKIIEETAQNSGIYRIGTAVFPAKPGDPPAAPEELKAPSFTNAQAKKLAMPDKSQALAASAKGDGGIISKLLERKDEQD